MSHATQPYRTLVNEGQAVPEQPYAEQHPMTQQPQVVVHNTEVSTYSVVPGSSFKWCDFVMSLMTFFCCNGLLSLFGIVYAANSYVSHGEKLYERSRRQNSLSRIFWIISFITGLVVWIVIIAAIAVLLKQQQKQVIGLQAG